MMRLDVDELETLREEVRAELDAVRATISARIDAGWRMLDKLSHEHDVLRQERNELRCVNSADWSTLSSSSDDLPHR